ncbi:MAG TPA: universal stress protein [Candidatus Methylomirabilis sp.]|nr:universal stress protein [Candidatus Methylomirabilis sp.]
MQLKDIVFPTDFSGASELAGRVAAELARQSGAKLHVIHVVPPVTDPADSGQLLDGLAKTIGDGIATQAALLYGWPIREIAEYARAKGAGLIVVGSHGRSGMSRALLGSVAEGVVRLARCMVLTVPPTAAAIGAAAASETVPALDRCLRCGRENEGAELVCGVCRTKIRAEALEQKAAAERAGRRGSSA